MSRRTILYDIDGVLTISWAAIPGASDAVARMREAGWRTAFVTNASMHSRRVIADLLASAGIPASTDEVFTAPRAAAHYLHEHHRGAGCLLLNSGSLEDDLEGVKLVEEGAEVVLTGGAGPEIGYDLLNRAYRCLLEGAELVAMHRNVNWATTAGLQLDIGPIVLALEAASGVEATVVGKPAPEFYGSILEELGTSPAETVMIGDDIESDVLGAQALGMRGVLVRTGKFRPENLHKASGTPDDVIDSAAELPRLLGVGLGESSLKGCAK